MPKVVPRDGEKQTLRKLTEIWDGLFGMARAECTGMQLEVWLGQSKVDSNETVKCVYLESPTYWSQGLEYKKNNVRVREIQGM